MKFFSTLIICTVFLCQLQAQTKTIDSLRNLIVHAKDDSNKAKVLLDLSFNFIFFRPDSSIIFANQAAEISKRCGYVKGELDAMGRIANAYGMIGDYSTSLEMSFEKLRKSEELNDKYLIATSYANIFFAYAQQGDFERSLQYLFKVRDLSKESNNDSLLSTTLINMGHVYIDLLKLDSARIFINEGLELALRRGEEDKVGACYLNLGLIYTQMKIYDLAKNYLFLSLRYFKTSNQLFISSVHSALANIFESTGRIDSAFYYARESYRRAKPTGSPDLILYPATQLVSFFKKTHQSDSALFYEDMVMQIKDSLTSNDKQKRLQNITFQQQLKQMQKDKEKLQQVEERKRNLQVAGVAVFLPLFFGFVLLLSRRQIKPRAVEILGIVFLLFVFEFITLYFHPIVGKWTNESPIWMLLIFVAIACILVPLHHRSESWIKKQLALQRTKELRKRVRMGEVAQKKLDS